MTSAGQQGGSSIVLHSAMLAEYAKVDASGLFQIVSGGIGNFSTNSLPALLSLGIAIETSNLSDVAITVPLLIQVSRPDGSGVVRVAGQMELEAAVEHSNMAMNLPVEMNVEGRWTVSVSFGEGDPTAELGFNVSLTQ